MMSNIINAGILSLIGLLVQLIAGSLIEGKQSRKLLTMLGGILIFASAFWIIIFPFDLIGINTPAPILNIVTPSDVVNCTEGEACNLTVRGASLNVGRDMKVYVMVFPVDPVGSGWYPQIQPAIVGKGGIWMQPSVWLGYDERPPESHDVFKLVALAIPHDKELPAQPVQKFEDVDYVAMSNIVDLVVRRN